ncbi:DUF4333 domain-containing protein [Saccharopolyspora shandongensis]|uniref:DUF4333 domain-containing protein n=1 Tax=Saccharopolyspora shandongensis TaxID=418495 RepID=UPI0033EFB30B
MQPAAPGYPQPGGFTPQQQPPPPQQPPQPSPQAPPQQPPQYGYGQQYPPVGAQFQQQGGFGQFDEFGPKKPKKKRSALPWVFAGIIVVILALVVLVLGFITPGWFVKPVFDSASVEKGVSQTLRSSYSLTGVGQVSCPAGQQVAVGHRFDCKVTIDSQPKTVTVTVKNVKGVYEVGHPR